MFSLSSSSFDKLLDKATSNLLLEPDWNVIIQISDSIRGGDIKPKYAVNAIMKKVYSENPHVSLYALQVLESCVKNCGSSFHAEIASKAFMEEIRDLIKISKNEKVKEKLLELIQTWAHAFRKDPSYRAVQDTVNLMKIEGYKFPALKESDAMFVADSAPQWEDGDNCNRCRVAFSVVQRKHHCRNCGQIFCAKCSAKQSIIPKYGIEKEVRVCDDCHDKLNKPTATEPKARSNSNSESSPFKDTSAVKASAPPTKSEQELIEEEELQMALALSKSEAESKEKERERMRSYSNPKYVAQVASEPVDHVNGSSPKHDAELSRYLNRDYWEQRATQSEERSKSPVPSAPKQQQSSIKLKEHIKPENKLQVDESDDINAFLNTLKSAIEIFVNRMNSNQLRGRPIANDSAVQSLFLNITNMHSQLLKYIQEQDDARVEYESLQDKLSQIRDARAALDSLREEHQDKLRKEAEDAERIRQQQMAQKLEIMRKKKQEYLQYQREMALQRVQEQEREMQLRKEQQKYIWQQHQQQQQPGGQIYGHPQGAYPHPGVYGPVQPQMPTQNHGPHPGERPNLAHVSSPIHAQQYHQSPPQGPVYAPEYSTPYNMQNVAAALPKVEPSANHPSMPPQQSPGIAPQGMNPDPNSMPQPVFQHPNPVPQQPHVQQKHEEPLISFD